MYHFTIDRAHFLVVYEISETKINEEAALRSCSSMLRILID